MGGSAKSWKGLLMSPWTPITWNPLAVSHAWRAAFWAFFCSSSQSRGSTMADRYLCEYVNLLLGSWQREDSWAPSWGQPSGH